MKNTDIVQGVCVDGADRAVAACCEPMPCAAPEDRVSAARRRHDAARNKHASSAAVVRKAREVLTHLEHDAYIAERELREANEALLHAIREDK